MLPSGIGCFAGDLPEEEQKIVWATAYPPAASLFASNAPGVAWRTKPSWYIVAANDHSVHPELERAAAKRMGATTYEFDSSHVPMLSQPDRVLDVIRTAAKSICISTEEPVSSRASGDPGRPRPPGALLVIELARFFARLVDSNCCYIGGFRQLLSPAASQVSSTMTRRLASTQARCGPLVTTGGDGCRRSSSSSLSSSCGSVSSVVTVAGRPGRITVDPVATAAFLPSALNTSDIAIAML
ncbi:MAG TPA: alpha/beta fold hydrolase, partial [Solirubrobacteraceae bacterium]|nr:alpha/beta fold hydrolase [Solirubrobacteraceae bacterium]